MGNPNNTQYGDYTSKVQETITVSGWQSSNLVEIYTLIWGARMNNTELKGFNRCCSNVQGEAVFDSRSNYRYRLSRIWEDTEFGTDDWYKNVACFILNNPAKADEVINDNTTTNCMRIIYNKNQSGSQSYKGIVIYNLFAFIGRPSELPEDPKVIGPDNERFLTEAARYETIIAGWGNCKIKQGNKNLKDGQIRMLVSFVNNKKIQSLCPCKQDYVKVPYHPSRLNNPDKEIYITKWKIPPKYNIK